MLGNGPGGGGRSGHSPSRFERRQPRDKTVGLVRDFLNDVRHVATVDERLKPLLNDPSVRATIQRDETAIPATKDREGYFDDRHLSYWLSGLDDLRAVQRLIPASAMTRVLDFGGASGRFARQVALAHESAKVTIAELNVNHIAWVDDHFGPAIRAVKVSPYPHFPLGDGSVSLCVALSVFTHIDSYETGWLAEIHRVLETGGYAFITIHSEDTWPLVLDMPHILKLLKKDPSFQSTYRPGLPMPDRRLVFDYASNSIENNCNVFMHSGYIRRCWGKWFDIVGIYPRAHHGFQTIVVMQKRD